MIWPFSKKSKTIDQIAEEIDGGGSNGVAVTEKSAREITAVLACIDVIASGCSVPELHVMRDLGDGKKEKALDQGIYRVLHRRPNEWQTSFEFREMMTMHAALSGNAYAIKVRNVLKDGEITELWPVMGHQVAIQNVKRYDLTYTVTDEFGLIGRFKPDDILHIRNRSWDRAKGLNAVRTAARALGLSLAVDGNISKMHENGGRPSGYLSTEQPLNDEALARIKAGWANFTRGANRYKTAILDNGMGYTPLAMSAVDSQTNETRKMQIEEICRAFGVFPIMVGHSDKTATYASAEAFFAANNRKTVARWQRIWSEKLDEFVLDGAGPLFVEFDNQEIRTANIKDQGEFFARALGTGGGVPWMTVNEVRAARGLGPIEGGEVLREPAASTVAPKGAGDEKQDDI